MILTEISALQQIGFPILSVLLWLTVAAIVALALIRNERLAYRIALAAAGLVFALTVFLLTAFQTGVADMQFVEHPGGLLGIEYHLGIDGISALFVPLTALLSVLAILYTEPAVKANVRGYLMAILGFEAAMIGAFVSVDLLLFWIFFVLELIPSYYLIVHYGTGEKRQSAARNYLGVMLAAAALMLAGFVLLAVNHANSTDAGLSFNLIELLAIPVPAGLQTGIFFLLCLGFAIKAPIFPFHTWMPRVLEQGPVVGMSVFLVGTKLGTYAFLRFIIPLLPEASHEWFWLLALMGGVGMIYGALIALVQTDLRRLLAFASLSHMGVVVIGLFSLNFSGFEGALLQMINLGACGAGLFFIAGFLYTRVGPPEIASLGGLFDHVPKLSLTFLVIGLASIGMPGTNGFNGEHLVIIGAFERHWAMAAAIGLGIFLGAAYFLLYYLRGFMGAVNNPAVKTLADLDRREWVISLSMVVLIFWIGLATGPFLRIMEGSLQALTERMEHGSYSTFVTEPVVDHGKDLR
ncbi:MAG: NADH-quinone oxidoreductase subunit M [Chloroflexota bacterium]|nr:NADH-quinone oxidoreductase subunit M [Chloroflexota bacterium]